MVRTPAAAIRNLLVLEGLGDFEKFRGPVRSPKWPFWLEPGATGEFSVFIWLIRTAFALRNFLTMTTLGGVCQFFRQFAIYWVFGKEGEVLGSNPG